MYGIQSRDQIGTASTATKFNSRIKQRTNSATVVNLEIAKQRLWRVRSFLGVNFRELISVIARAKYSTFDSFLM